MMKHERPNWTRFSDRMVKLRWEGGTSWAPPRETVVPCPIIAWAKDKARVLVITPAGFKQ